MSSRPVLKIASRMRRTEMPAARIAVSSELLASVPRPTRLPIRAAIGKASKV